MSFRKKRRREQRQYGPLLGLLFLGGCALFLFESQTFGRFAIAIGLGWGLFWVGVRYLARTGSDPLQAAGRWRWPLVGCAVLLVAAGWVVFLTAWEELGLLFVLLGAVPLLILVAGVRHEPLLSPMDGPTFGDTGPT